MDIYEIRRKNLHQLIQKYEGAARLARRLGHKGNSYISQLSTGHRPVTERTARDIERELRLPTLWFDAPPGATVKSLEPVAQPPVEMDKLIDAISAVLGWLEKEGRLLPAKAAAEAIVFTHQESIKGHVVDTGNAIRLISR